MIKFKKYKDKVKGCWWGKYAGGVLGMPFEGLRGTIDLDWYTQKNLKGIDNDDIDLQLVWLRACEKFGNRVDSHILAEYWLTYINGDPSEYGASKTNLRMHVAPPYSGLVGNINKNSCGGFIRSEIWACICAGNPDLAVRYAMEDAMVDHADDGVYGEVFMAALQSEAFVESDIRKLINLALTYIPSDCGVAKAVNCALDCYDSKLDWKEARKRILQVVPSGFTYGNYYPGYEKELDVPLGPTGYDAPANVGIAIMSILFGEYDFKKTICIAAGCMEDGDCTTGSAGSTLAIILGYEKLPKEWLKPLGEKLVSGCLRNDGDLLRPNSIDELIDRVLRLTPIFLGGTIVNTLTKDEGYEIEPHVNDVRLLMFPAVDHESHPRFDVLLNRIKTGITFKSVLFATTVHLENGVHISYGEQKRVRLQLWNYIWQPQWLKIKWIMPEGIRVVGSNEKAVLLESRHGGDPKARLFNGAECEFILETTDNLNSARLDTCIEIESNGRFTKVYIPLSFLVK